MQYTESAIHSKVKKKKRKRQEMEDVQRYTSDAEGEEFMQVDTPPSPSSPDREEGEPHKSNKKKKKHKKRRHSVADEEGDGEVAPSEEPTPEDEDPPAPPRKKKKKKHKKERNEEVVAIEVEEEEQRSGDEAGQDGDVARSRKKKKHKKKKMRNGSRDGAHSGSGSEGEGEGEGEGGMPSFIAQEYTDVIYDMDSSDDNAAPPRVVTNVGRNNKHRPWTKAEDEILTNNWKRIAEESQLDEPFYLLNQNHGEARDVGELRRLRTELNLTASLSLGLNRNSVGVYNRARKLFDPSRNTKLSVEDLKLMTEVRNKSGKLRWSNMAVDLGVSGQKLIQFVRSLKRKLDNKSKYWNEQDDEALTQAVIKEKGSVNHLDGIPWFAIAKHVPGKNDVQCRSRWVQTLHWQKVYGTSKRPFGSEDQLELILELRKMNVLEEFYIDWYEVRSKLSSQTEGAREVKLEWHKLKCQVPGYIMADFNVILDWLEQHVVPKLEADLRDQLRLAGEGEELEEGEEDMQAEQEQEQQHTKRRKKKKKRRQEEEEVEEEEEEDHPKQKKKKKKKKQEEEEEEEEHPKQRKKKKKMKKEEEEHPE